MISSDFLSDGAGILRKRLQSEIYWKDRKSDLVIQAVWEYIGNHPEVMAEDAKIVISVHSTPTDEQTFAKIQSMIDASLEKLKTTLKLQLEQGQPEDASGPSEKDLDDMLKNLDIFNL